MALPGSGKAWSKGEALRTAEPFQGFAVPAAGRFLIEPAACEGRSDPSLFRKVRLQGFDLCRLSFELSALLFDLRRLSLELSALLFDLCCWAIKRPSCSRT